MTNAATNTTGAKAAGFYQRMSHRWNEVGDWLTANYVDLLIAIAAATLVALLLLTAKRFGHRLVHDKDQAISWQAIAGRVLARTKLFFIVIVALKLVAGQASPPPFIERAISFAFIVAVTLQAAIWARELVLGFIQHRIGDEDDQGRLSSAIGIIRLLVSVALFVIATIVILDNLGVNVTGLVAGLGIGGIAIGLAAQGIFSDLFAALAIIFDRPFRRGDTITFGTTTGTVEQIGLKTTRVRALNGEQVIIANTKLLEQQVQNWALLRIRRAVMQLALVYHTPADVLAKLPGELEAIVERQPLAAFDRAHIWQFGASSIDLELVFHVDSADMAEFMTVRQAVMLAIIGRFAELGVEFAYPTQTTYTAAPDGTLILPYAAPAAPKP